MKYYRIRRRPLEANGFVAIDNHEEIIGIDGAGVVVARRIDAASLPHAAREHLESVPHEEVGRV